MITITYDPVKGKAVSDGEADGLAKTLKKSASFSTENVFLSIRLLIKKKLLSHKDICFKFKDQVILLNEDGRLLTYPTGFIDFSILKIYALMQVN